MKYLLWSFILTFLSPLLFAQPFTEIQSPKIHLINQIACTEVKDQSQSPTCWVFGTNSLFESDLMKKRGVQLDLSEMFIARYAYIDKLRKYLATKGKTYYEGGGQFHDVIRIVNLYGMVTEEAYSGKPHGEYDHNHTKLDTAMRRLGRMFLRMGKTELTAFDLKRVNDTLDLYLGKVPATFRYDHDLYSPKTFAEKIVQFGNDYIEFMSFADLPLYKKDLLADKFNWAGDSLYNIPLADMQMLIDTALAKGWSVGWEGDVTNAGFNSSIGFAALNDSSENYDADRVLNYKNETTERDHMLHLVGIGLDEKDRKWYYLKNSWGTWFHNNGFLFMNENYFKTNTVIVMVNKKGLPESLKEKLSIQ